MGAYSPAPVVTPEVHERIIEQVIKPTIAGLAKDGIPYTGFLYAGLMIDEDGNIKVIEFNCRFGDPETQPVMLRMTSDLAKLCIAATDGNLEGMQIEFDDNVALTVVVASGGYPGDYVTGCVIDGLGNLGSASQIKKGKVFHAGTEIEDGQIKSSGGRVLGVTSLGRTVREAQSTAYELIDSISFMDMYYRTDIGYRAVARED